MTKGVWRIYLASPAPKQGIKLHAAIYIHPGEMYKSNIFQFSEINGDAIDTSGSKVYINNGIINKIDDKAISIGENSDI